ncbi:uncharacterized protein PHACADRAFT_264328 [Phanerochaete carnosa HHB-10118-sp]|uniref:Thioredoxin domain-containing protein n=1 Tax=Phanerochaete carnosa (strain HHB-10118-sp) TaxID=650164 RepID=K5WKQ8_PHACS|nr:uncharacterized protein PHACADRAFT_264328 [Phanerochaete carnosa HHB-10118-sp]EKM50817.1 hypothetical protein PHACADRAFT_264328 [Phanerochaete carnosa HHB-10118-sp]
MFRPVFEQIAESTGVIEDVDFYSVNCTDAPREMYPAIEAIKSQGVPAVGVFSRGDLFAEVSGFIPLGEFRRWLSECMTLRGQQYSDEQTVRAQQVMKTVQSMQVGGEPVIIPVKDGNRFKSLVRIISQ